MDKQKEIDKINSCISELVYEKIQLKKAYNYYHCIRDAEQFKHLEDNFGIGTPTSVGFTPLIKKHIDVLVGEYLELDPDLQVSCKDEKTISNIMRDKQLKINQEVFLYLKQRIESGIIGILMEGKLPMRDPYIEKEIEKIKKDIDKNFISEYEIAAQNILNYVKNSRNIDMKNKLRELLTDLLITGICYYRVRPSGSKDNLSLEILNPLDTFVERNYNEFYLNRSPRAVIRKWMDKTQIMKEYGDELNSEARSKLDDILGKGWDNAGSVWVRTEHTTIVNDNGLIETKESPSPGILGGLEVAPMFPWNEAGQYNYRDKPVIPVYECEWIEWDDKNERLTRHEGIRIGHEIYITRGESENIIRSITNPKDCTLSINGMFFSDKNGNPFSIVLNTMDLQDRYDLLIYYRDNLIETSGTVGDWIDVSHLPSFLGGEIPERLAKWNAYKKNGQALFDSSQEGANLINTTFNGYDDTVKLSAIQAIQMAIESVEQQASSITGVFAEKLGGIQQRDAVSNVKVGIRQSTLLTKQYFHAMDLMYKEINYDMLNLAKIVFKDGISGTIILGNKLSKVFTALPEYYTVTDFDLHIADSSETFQIRQDLQQSGIELIKAGAAGPEMLVNMVTAKNLTELKDYINTAVREKDAENNQIQQLTEKLEEADQTIKQFESQMKQLQEQNSKLQKEVEKNSQQKLAIEQERVRIEEKKVDDAKEYNTRIAANKERQLDLEYLQLSDNNPYNDKIRDV